MKTKTNIRTRRFMGDLILESGRFQIAVIAVRGAFFLKVYDLTTDERFTVEDKQWSFRPTNMKSRVAAGSMARGFACTMLEASPESLREMRNLASWNATVSKVW